MKKVFLFFSSALICAAFAACGGNNEATDSTNTDTLPAMEQTQEAAPAPEATDATVDMNARQQAIADAAQQICNCGNVLDCVNTVIDQSFAQYANDAEFKAAVKAEAEKCIANKVKGKAVEKGKEVAKDAAKQGLQELGKQLNK